MEKEIIYIYISNVYNKIRIGSTLEDIFLSKSVMISSYFYIKIA